MWVGAQNPGNSLFLPTPHTTTLAPSKGRLIRCTVPTATFPPATMGHIAAMAAGMCSSAASQHLCKPRKAAAFAQWHEHAS